MAVGVSHRGDVQSGRVIGVAGSGGVGSSNGQRKPIAVVLVLPRVATTIGFGCCGGNINAQRILVQLVLIGSEDPRKLVDRSAVGVDLGDGIAGSIRNCEFAAVTVD